MQKLRIGWFSFTCCEDSTIMFTELFNTHYAEWLEKIEFVHARIFRRDDTEEIKEMDVAFVEGAINSDHHEEKLKAIRAKAKKLIAIGSCACTGSPSNHRNFFNEANYAEIKPILDQFKYKDKVHKLADFVTVDQQVNGCPMDNTVFLTVLNNFLQSKEVQSQITS